MTINTKFTRPMPAIASPCINICRLDDATGLCEGCGRSIDEIACWAALSEDARTTIMAGLPSRLEGVVRRGG